MTEITRKKRIIQRYRNIRARVMYALQNKRQVMNELLRVLRRKPKKVEVDQ